MFELLMRIPFLGFDMLQVSVLGSILIFLVVIELLFYGIHCTASKMRHSNPDDNYIAKFNKIEMCIFKRIIFLLRYHNLPYCIAKINSMLEIVLGLLLGRFKDGSQRYNYSIINVMIPDFTFATENNKFVFPSSKVEVNCYFLMLCTKLSYECDAILQKIGVTDWKQGGSDTVLTSFAYKLNLKVVDHQPKTIPPETYAFVRHDAKSIVVCFRGTEPLSVLDWATDFYAEPEEHTYGGKKMKLHQGFYDALMTNSTLYVGKDRKKDCSIFNAIVEYIRDIKDLPEKKLYVSGHSLGAALATLFCYLLHQLHPDLAAKIETICTIGEPIVGDEEYALDFNDIFKNKMYRYQHAADIVTTDFQNFDHNVNDIPKLLGKLVYFHHDGYRYISYDRTITTVLSGAMVKVRSDKNRCFYEKRRLLRNPGDETWLRTLSRYVMPLFLSDHFPDGYQAALRSAAENAK